ncbi:ABC transporter substrate-binding protein [Undibacterium arcticum]
MAFEAPDDGFDPIRTTNFYSHWISSAINEPLLTYDYLARPAKLVPAAADAMPEVGDAGKTYTFHIKKGIYFSADPAFKGVRRELTAQDFAYTFKRLLDPQNRSPPGQFRRRQDCRTRCVSGRGEKKERSFRLRCAGRRFASAGSLHPAHPADSAGLQFLVCCRL